MIIGNPKSQEVVDYLKNECRNMKNVKLHLAYIDDDEIQTYMNAADFVVLPFKSILSSGSMMLAVSFGKPIIAPKLGHINEVLDGSGSIIYDPNDKDGLLISVQTCLKLDAHKIEQMGKNNLKIAEEYNWDTVVKRKFALYQEALKKLK